MQFHQKSGETYFFAESGVTEKGINSSDSLPSKEETDFQDIHEEQEWVQHGAVPPRLQPLSLTNRIQDSHADSIPSPLPSHHTQGSRRTAGRVALKLHRHFYTQGAGSAPALGSALHPWLGR